MSNPVVLSSSAAHRIRTAVTQISMLSRPFGGLRGNETRIPIPMPLDIQIKLVGGVPHATISLIGLWVTCGRNDIDIDRQNPLLLDLITNWDNGDNDYDTGPITTAKGFILYIITRLASENSKLVNRMYWGIVSGANLEAAENMIPSISANPAAAGDVTGLYLDIPLGGIEFALGKPFTWQAYHGCINVPAYTETELVLDTQYDVVNHQLQKKTAKALIFQCGPASDWTMIEGGQAELYPDEEEPEPEP